MRPAKRYVTVTFEAEVDPSELVIDGDPTGSLRRQAEEAIGNGRAHYGESVLQEWVHRLPLRAQGTLLAAIRGCDVAPKYPLDSPERRLVAWLRGCVMVPYDPREVDRLNGSFMSYIRPSFDANSATGRRPFKWAAVGHYPLHWQMHVIHALKIIAMSGGREGVEAHGLYAEAVGALHLAPEDSVDTQIRLLEDRMASGQVGS